MRLRFLLQASIAAFGTYFCMYAFRKPFTVATFANESFIGIDYKILLIIAQVIGYTLSKFIGIKIIAEMKSSKRILFLIGFILFAELALLGFATVPAPYNIVCLFFNGLPLGMIWGIVFSYLEGRKATELLGVILSSSFIVSSGAVKSVGKIVLDIFHFNEYWMPFITGGFFIIPLIFFAWLLERLPEPTKEDKLLRTVRKPLDKTERKRLFRKFAIPLILIVLFFMLLTSIRDFRDNFAREIWDALGYEDASIYSISEIPIAITVLIVLGFIGSVTKNFKAFMYYHYVLMIGCISIIISTLLFQQSLISPLVWMTISGLGLYSCYVPFNGIFFDRMIATFKIKGNVGFLIYIADAFGYLGSILILLYKNFGKGDISWLSFFITALYFLAFIGLIITTYCFQFFRKKYKKPIQIQELIYEQQI
ncbi:MULTISPECIES: DUF5690 family protein [unclassified Tenacibaculum]|uniref:DUF5690 family protein n=1 Tax=unclassified Tenacibaculum TaxID=2635139 RepID=UPI001F1B8282|nr:MULTISPECIES: DUF5690 family protein [unclassified Tenacibaculum]MCF2874167.1 DUF5690 family protein [Tenacibaculum sp. Cn5-1]MCF2934748.1 DUF5690 family protein [Tenacibaculum sp. Cn5-34]MCG7510958.1 DUF5690 family protein [Tenacibaculum sp. Cn5-46]